MKTQKKITMNFTFLINENGIDANFKFNAEKGNNLGDILQCLQYSKECINEKVNQCIEKITDQIENN